MSRWAFGVPKCQILSIDEHILWSNIQTEGASHKLSMAVMIMMIYVKQSMGYIARLCCFFFLYMHDCSRQKLSLILITRGCGNRHIMYNSVSQANAPDSFAFCILSLFSICLLPSRVYTWWSTYIMRPESLHFLINRQHALLNSCHHTWFNGL